MKNGRYFNFRDICDRNLWDMGYLVKKLQGYGILRPPLMGPQFKSALPCFPRPPGSLGSKTWPRICHLPKDC